MRGGTALRSQPWPPGSPEVLGKRRSQGLAKAMESGAGALRRELAEGRLQVRAGLVLDLAEAAEAHRQLEGRGTAGKVVLRVP
ncbi:zinc-binding dehydrogenase [Pyxidicoccus trucidator]|uniref:zinc-binding dehydrogenase n=1 Tax=Pyxidicoccus trucidator TaxID=2709662 RepID=UPI003B832669